MSHSTFERKSSTLKRIFDLSDHLTFQLPKSSEPTEIVKLLYLFAFDDLAEDILLLIDRNRFNNIPLLMRSFFETYLDFKLILKDEAHIHSLILKAQKEEVKIPTSLLKNNLNEDQKAVLNSAKDFLIKDNQERVEAGYNSMTIKDKCKKLGLEDIYELHYNELSAYCHNAILVLERKYLSYSAEEGKIIFNHRMRSNPSLIEHHISLINLIYLNILSSLNDEFQFGIDDTLNELSQIINSKYTN